jgi:hypothetical protein
MFGVEYFGETQEKTAVLTGGGMKVGFLIFGPKPCFFW